MLPIVEIVRLEDNKLYGTFGVLLIDKEVFCCTLEPPNKDNQNDISCIPYGHYIAIKTYSPRFKRFTYMLQDVPFRSSIEFHPGNTVDDTHGCILLGQYFGKLRTDKRAVLNSGVTYSKFIDELSDYEKIKIVIKDCF